jgi:hypothetical protein
MRHFFLPAVILLTSFFAAQGQTTPPNDLLQKFIDLQAPGFQKSADAEKEGDQKERPKEFFNDDNPPPDDAPIEDILAYWSAYSSVAFSTTYKPPPSKKTLERILEYCRGNPKLAARYVGIFPPDPEIASVIKDIYDDQTKAQNSEVYQLQEWLKYNSTYYLDDLLKGANGIKDENNYVQNQNQYFLRALARVDWNSAQPIVSRLENDISNPYSQILAKWVSYQHAIDTGDFATENAYRHDLQKIVENKQAPWGQRDLAMDSLTVSNDWEGRDEWYLSLLDDETLLTIQENGYTGLTTLISNSPKARWREKMLELTKSANSTVRTAAARNLMGMYREGDTEIAKALLPWLSDPAWAKQSGNNERSTLIKALGETDVPESVPGLIFVVLNEEENREVAAAALGKYKDPRAVPALRTILASQDTYEGRTTYIGALFACSGFTDDEQMADLEAYAAMMSTETGKTQIQEFEQQYDDHGDHFDSDGEGGGEEGEGAREPMVATASGTVSMPGDSIPARGAMADDEEPKPIPMQISIGSFLAGQEEPGEGLVVRALARLKILKKRNPAVALTLEEIIEKWKGRAIFLETLRRIRSGESTVDDLLMALANRKDMREKVPAELASMPGSGGIARGIGACINESTEEYLSILGGEDPEAQITMLGCTRLLRAPLPVLDVGGLLASPDKRVALAAERYLETEDSLEARKMVLAGNKGEALILGARTTFIPDVKNIYSSSALDSVFQTVTGEGVPFTIASFQKTEDDLRKEIKANPEMLAVYAMLPGGANGARVVRAFKDRVVFTYYEDSARYWERNLSREEYQDLYNYLLEKNIDSLRPVMDCNGGCLPGEFVMFGRDGGRRVYYASNILPAPLDKLSEMFDSFSRAEETKLHYRLGESTAGLETLWTNKKLPARAVWAKDGDLRVLIEDTEKAAEIENDLSEKMASITKDANSDGPTQQARYEAIQKQALEMKYAHVSWRKLENGRADTIVPQPPDAPFIYDSTQAPEIPNIRSTPRAWQVRTGTGEIRAGEYYEPGLFRVSPGQAPIKMKEGQYENPIASGDGKWVVVSRYIEEEEFNGLVRINLQTGREFKVGLPPSDSILPVAFIPSHNKVLVYRAGKAITPPNTVDPEGAESAQAVRAGGEYYLLDAATGVFLRVKGEFRPLQEQTYRPLQPTGVAGESWAALPDTKTGGTSIGRYNEKLFTFHPVMTLPNIRIDSMAMWINEAAGKIYFVYEGHLLAVPLKKL